MEKLIVITCISIFVLALCFILYHIFKTLCEIGIEDGFTESTKLIILYKKFSYIFFILGIIGSIILIGYLGYYIFFIL